jgi:glycine oxidase
VKKWDAVVIGGGAIGLSLALRLKAQHLSVLVVEKHEPARESTWAAGGMIASCDPHTPDALRDFADTSARIYPDFARELEELTGETVDLRDTGTIASFAPDEEPCCSGTRQLTAGDLLALEPSLCALENAWYLPERSVDPRALGRTLAKAAKLREVDFVTGSAVLEILVSDSRATGVRTAHGIYSSDVVVNCAGAWAAEIKPFGVPTRPVKGQMVCVVPQAGISSMGPLIRHVVRTPEIYIIPRSDGRILLGATTEEKGFDKQVDPETIQRFVRSAVQVAPVLAETRIHDAWAGLRPGSPDGLPILGETALRGYFAATGHYRDGIMLAPATADAMTALITGGKVEVDLTPFSPLRFE